MARPVSCGRHEGEERENAAFALVVGPHDEGEVLDGDDGDERPEDEREHAQDVGVRGRDAVLALDALFDGVERARADVAEDDAERADDERRERRGMRVIGMRLGGARLGGGRRRLRFWRSGGSRLHGARHS